MSKIMRKANINMRTTEQEKILLEKAAHLAGFSNLTNFMMTAARKEAIRIVNDMNTTHVSGRDWDKIVALLSNPPEPNDNLKKLLQRKEAINEKLDSGKTG